MTVLNTAAAGLAAVCLTACAATTGAAPDAAPNAPATAAPPALAPRLAVFAPMIGHTYYGAPLDAPDGAAGDIQKWEIAVGGRAVRVTHAIEDGSYGGESLIYPDAQSDVLAYVYVTSAGFRTEGVMVIDDDGSWTAEEDVSGHPTVSKVRSTGRKRADGSLSMRSSFFDKTLNEWRSGGGFDYVLDDDRELNFPNPMEAVVTPGVEAEN